MSPLADLACGSRILGNIPDSVDFTVLVIPPEHELSGALQLVSDELLTEDAFVENADEALLGSLVFSIKGSELLWIECDWP